MPDALNAVSNRAHFRAIWRMGVGVVLATTLVWITWLRFPALWDKAGMDGSRAFVDLTSILAASDASRAGVDPYTPNAFDPYHRPHFLSDWWLILGRLGLTRSDVSWLGVLLLGATIVGAVWAVRPRSLREAVLLWLVLVSPALLLGANRANVDFFVFLLVSAGLAAFRRPEFGWRLAGLALCAISAVLKFYPLVTLLLLIELRSWRQALLGAAVYGAVVAAGAPGFVRGLAATVRYAPATEWLYAFGAPSLWRDFGMRGYAGWIATGVLAIGVAGWLALRRPISTDGTCSESSEADAREFAVGSVMIAGVFFMGASYLYKLVLAIWLLPGLTRSSVFRYDAGWQWRRAVLALLLALLWFEGLAAFALNTMANPAAPAGALALRATLVIAQLLAWGLVICLLSETLRWIAQRWRILSRTSRQS